jgi:hypothetical protein
VWLALDYHGVNANRPTSDVHNPGGIIIRVDAEDGEAATLEALAQIADVEKLRIAIGTDVGGNGFVVDAARIAHLAEQARDGIGTDLDPKVAERQGHLGGRPTGPFHACDRIPGGVVFQQERDQGDEVGRFFSTGGRPPPTRRTRPGATS